MEKLSIEEKAKAYDKAREKIAVRFGTNVAEEIFSEFEESEDEKIRKFLIKWIQDNYYHGTTEIPTKTLIAWLEKQGKQPSAIRWYDVSLIPQEMEELLVEWDSEDATWHEIAFYHADTKTFWNGTRQVENVTRWCYIIDLLEKQGEQKSYGQREECFDCQFNYAGECKSSCAMKRGEQKPFDYENANIQQKDFAPQEDASRYSIGDVLCDKSCTTLDKDAQPNYEIVDIRNGLYICDKGYIPISQQDEYELVAKKIEQKPARSEEDEKHVFRIKLSLQKDIMVHKNSGVDITDLQDCEDWLKSLKERIGG